MTSFVVILPGDGIGPDVTVQAVRVLEAAAARHELDLNIEHALIGGAAIDAVGHPLPAETLELCRRADALFLGAVGGPRWMDVAPKLRPEQGLLGLRRALDLFGLDWDGTRRWGEDLEGGRR